MSIKLYINMDKLIASIKVKVKEAKLIQEHIKTIINDLEFMSTVPSHIQKKIVNIYTKSKVYSDIDVTKLGFDLKAWKKDLLTGDISDVEVITNNLPSMKHQMLPGFSANEKKLLQEQIKEVKNNATEEKQ